MERTNSTRLGDDGAAFVALARQNRASLPPTPSDPRSIRGETDPIAPLFQRLLRHRCQNGTIRASAAGSGTRTSARRGSQPDFERIVEPVAARTSREDAAVPSDA